MYISVFPPHSGPISICGSAYEEAVEALRSVWCVARLLGLVRHYCQSVEVFESLIVASRESKGSMTRSVGADYGF